jgi:hypothetical protein
VLVIITYVKYEIKNVTIIVTHSIILHKMQKYLRLPSYGYSCEFSRKPHRNVFGSRMEEACRQFTVLRHAGIHYYCWSNENEKVLTCYIRAFSLDAEMRNG